MDGRTDRQTDGLMDATMCIIALLHDATWSTTITFSVNFGKLWDILQILAIDIKNLFTELG